MDEPNDEPTERPTNTQQQAEAEGAWMGRQWVAIASVSILALLVLVLGMMQWTGLIDVFGPIVDSTTGQWAAFGVIVVIVVIVATWGWRSVRASLSE